MTAQFDQIIASYHRARETGRLFDSFYDIFLGKSPEIPLMFARTDFPHQKLMLRESILDLLVFAQTGSGQADIQKLGEQHRQLKVTASHYKLWLDALCDALREHDPQFSPELEQMWRDSMRKGI